MPTNLTPGDGQDLLARWKRAWEGRDVELAMSLFTDQIDYRYDPFAPSLAGVNAVRAYWNDLVADAHDVEFDAERVWAVGRTVIASWHAAFTSSAQRARVRRRGITTFELDDEGRVERLREWSEERSEPLAATGRITGA